MTAKKPITDDRARQFYVHATAWDMEEVPKSSGSANARNVLAREWDAWLAAHDARVRRDASREALDGLAAHEMELHSRDPEVYAECKHVAVSARSWRETHYRLPETED